MRTAVPNPRSHSLAGLDGVSRCLVQSSSLPATYTHIQHPHRTQQKHPTTSHPHLCRVWVTAVIFSQCPRHSQAGAAAHKPASCKPWVMSNMPRPPPFSCGHPVSRLPERVRTVHLLSASILLEACRGQLHQSPLCVPARHPVQDSDFE